MKIPCFNAASYLVIQDLFALIQHTHLEIILYSHWRNYVLGALRQHYLHVGGEKGAKTPVIVKQNIEILKKIISFFRIEVK